MTRKKARVLFGFGTAIAVAITCIVLYSLTAGLSLWQTSLWLVGSLIVIWAGLFSFFEVRRIAVGRSTSIFWDGSEDRIDPDAPRVVIVEPPTDEATPHHEDHFGSEGLDQGQLTSRIPDTFPIAVTPTRAREQNKAAPRPNSTRSYFQELGKRFPEPPDGDPELERVRAHTTRRNADAVEIDHEKKPASGHSARRGRSSSRLRLLRPGFRAQTTAMGPVASFAKVRAIIQKNDSRAVETNRGIVPGRYCPQRR